MNSRFEDLEGRMGFKRAREFIPKAVKKGERKSEGEQ